MLPIQYMILELFENNNEIEINNINILNLLDNYDIKFKNNLINSLISSNILINKNSFLILNNNCNNININLINSFYEYTLSNYNYINTDILIFQYTNIEILETNINSILKIESLNYDTLFNKVKDKIKIFNTTKILFDKTLNEMINKDLIEMNNNIYSKLFY